MRSLARVSMLAALGVLAVPVPTAFATGPPGSMIAQLPADSGGGPRVMSFAWTLYPQMWAELDLRLARAPRRWRRSRRKGAT